MNSAALEALVETRSKAIADAAQNGNRGGGAANMRGQGDGTEPVFSDIEPSDNYAGAWRGSHTGFERRSSLSKADAGNVLRFLRGIVCNDLAELRDAGAKLGMERTTLQSVGVSVDGGTTLPAQFVSEVLIDLPKVTPFADPNIVRIIPMINETLRWTKVTARPGLPPSVKEGGQYTKTGVSFAPITLVAKKIGEIIPFTEEILQSNQIAMVQVISQLVSDAFAFKYNTLVTAGLGNADEPEGVLTNTDVVSSAFDDTNDLTKADSLITIFGSLPSQYRKLNSIWMLADSDITKVRKLKDSYGRYIWVDGFSARPDTLLGRPVFENPDLTAGTVLFGNFIRGYVIGKREGMTLDVNSSGTDWEKDIKNFKFRERWDGRVHDARAFVKGTGLS